MTNKDPRQKKKELPAEHDAQRKRSVPPVVTPAPKIPESKENLAGRAAWFRKRSGLGN